MDSSEYNRVASQALKEIERNSKFIRDFKLETFFDEYGLNNCRYAYVRIKEGL